MGKIISSPASLDTLRYWVLTQIIKSEVENIFHLILEQQ